MACRVLLVLGFLMAAVVLVSSHAAVAAQGELEEQQTKDAVKDVISDDKIVCGARGCCGRFRGRCTHCCHASEEAAGGVGARAEAGNIAVTGDAIGDDKHECGARGCCGRFRGHCTHCCHASEAAAGGVGANAEAKPKN